MRATSVMVLFLVFLQKGSFVSYLGSTIIKAVTKQAMDYMNLVRSLGKDDNDADTDDEENVSPTNAFAIDGH